MLSAIRASTGCLGHLDPAQRGGRQGQAMGGGKCGDGADQPRPVPHQKQQGENEQQVVDAEQDVFYAQREVSLDHSPGAGCRGGVKIGLGRRKANGLDCAIETFDSGEYVRPCLDQTGDQDGPAFQSAVTPGTPTFHVGTAHQSAGGLGGDAGLGQNHRESELASVPGWHFPEHVEGATGDLFDLQVAGADFMALNRADQAQKKACRDQRSNAGGSCH